MESWSFAERDEIVPGRRAVRLLGGGVRYEAYLAWDDRLRALVVVKVLRPDRTEDPGALQGLRGEAALLERLAHPLLVRWFGAGLEGERPHLVLEFIEGPRLSTLSRRFGLSLEQVLPLALNLASVLHYLAEERVVHLDVKPRNVVMGGSPRLIDLSVAMRLDQRRRHPPAGRHRRLHGAGAVRPGALRDDRPARRRVGPRRHDPRDADGRAAVRARRGERFPQLHAAPRPLPREVPPELAAAVLACLEPRPEDRPTAGGLADVLEPLAGALPPPRLGRFRPGGKALMGRLERS